MTDRPKSCRIGRLETRNRPSEETRRHGCAPIARQTVRLVFKAPGCQTDPRVAMLMTIQFRSSTSRIVTSPARGQRHGHRRQRLVGSMRKIAIACSTRGLCDSGCQGSECSPSSVCTRRRLFTPEAVLSKVFSVLCYLNFAALTICQASGKSGVRELVLGGRPQFHTTITGAAGARSAGVVGASSSSAATSS